MCGSHPAWRGNVKRERRCLGGYEVFVHAYGATPSNNVLCQAIGLDAFGHVIQSSAQLPLPQFGVNTTIGLPGEIVGGAGGGVLFAWCLVEPGATIYSYNW